jgi:hypothetical protein
VCVPGGDEEYHVRCEEVEGGRYGILSMALEGHPPALASQDPLPIRPHFSSFPAPLLFPKPQLQS